jgi:hypothetical protein
MRIDIEFKFDYNKIQQKHHNSENQSLNAKDGTGRQIN